MDKQVNSLKLRGNRIKSLLEPFVNSKSVKLEISEDEKIYIEVLKEKQKEFEDIFAKMFNIGDTYNEDELEDYDPNWVYYSYIPLYDWQGYEELGFNWLCLAYAIQELGLGGEFPYMIQMQMYFEMMEKVE